MCAEVERKNKCRKVRFKLGTWSSSSVEELDGLVLESGGDPAGGGLSLGVGGGVELVEVELLLFLAL